MTTTNYVGIDYGLGTANVDKETGIRYGVIPSGSVGQAWYDESEAYYGKPHCPHCSVELTDPEDGEPCPHCKKVIRWVGEECYGDEPLSWYVDNADVKAECCLDGDIFVFKSLYYTRCQFCSPCAPGAGYLLNECEVGPSAYCFGHDWFEGGKAPYRVWRVDNDEEVFPVAKD